MKTKWLWAATLVVAAAAPAVGKEGDEPKQKVIIMTERIARAGHADAREDAGPAHKTMILADCGGDRTDYSDSAGGGKDKTKIVICSRGNVSTAERAKRLEHALERINSNDELSAESKAKITTALRDAIARLNAEH